MSKEVRITLTEAQKAKIKAATGKTMGEIRVSKLGKNLAVSPAAGLSAKDMSIGSQDMSIGSQDLSAQDLSAEDLSAQDLSAEDLSAQDLSAHDLKAV